MAIACYLKIEGADGESKDTKHKDWCQLDAFSWGASQPSTMATGGGGGAGKVSFQDLTCMMSVDKAYSTALKHCAKGSHIGKIQVYAEKAGGSPIDYFKITLEDVLVTRVDVSGAQGAEVKISYSFSGAKLKTEYQVQTEKGGGGPTSEMTWNIKENKE